MSTKEITLRLNLSKAADRRAYEYLKSTPLSYSKAMIAAVNGYLDRLSEKEKEAAFLQKLQELLRQELRAAPMAGLLPFLQLPKAEARPSAEDEENVMAFLGEFDGEE